jgi:putative ABC transport system substrate-binding protein
VSKTMKRNTNILLFACTLLFALYSSAESQQAGKVFRIGFLDPSNASGSAALVEVFRKELSKLGWVEGRNIAIEYRFADQRIERLPELAVELVRLKVDLIVTGGARATRSVKEATVSIPIVMAQDPDPVGNGFVASLARPGGNVTGLASLSFELNTKRLEILKDTVPRLTRVGVPRLPEAQTSN